MISCQNIKMNQIELSVFVTEQKREREKKIEKNKINNVSILNFRIKSSLK